MNAPNRTWIPVLLAVPVVIFFSASPAWAQIGNVAMAELYGLVMDASKDWLTNSANIAMHILGTVAAIGFVIGIKDLVMAGNLTIEGIVALFVRFAFLVGIIVWLLSTPQRLLLIPATMKKIGVLIGGQSAGFGSLITLFSEVVRPLVDFANSLSWREFGLYICLSFLVFLINCLFFMISATLLCVEIEGIFVLVGGMFTAGFFVIGYFRDLFFGYLKGLLMVGVKLMLLSLCLGLISKIVSTWPALIEEHVNDATGVFTFLMPMASALVAFYMVVRAIPQYAAAILFGQAYADGGAVKAAMVTGFGLGMTVFNMSRSTSRGIVNSGGTVREAAQAYKNSMHTARDSGAGGGQAHAAGAWSAMKVVLGVGRTGTGSGPSSSGGGGGSGGNTLSAPPNPMPGGWQRQSDPGGNSARDALDGYNADKGK